MAGYEFVDCYNFNVPNNAVKAGKDLDGSDIYVGQAQHQGDLLPVKILARHRQAYVSYNGQETAVHHFKVLIQKSLCWVSSHNGQVPSGAIPAGRTSSGETLYFGRTKANNCTVFGKVHPSHRCLYVPFGGKEQSHNHYEVLVYH